MSAQRKRIRQAIVAALLNKTDAGANVFASRARKVFAHELPAILVYAREESAEVFNDSPRELRRVLSVGIEIAAAANDALDDTLDDIAEQVEATLRENQTLGGIVSDLVLTRAEIQFSGDGEKVHGACVLTYDATYYTYDVASGSDLVPFERAHVDWRQSGATADSPETIDQISLPQ